jgi:hypothetical protein
MNLYNFSRVWSFYISMAIGFGRGPVYIRQTGQSVLKND